MGKDSMQIKHIRNTSAAKWAEKNGYSVHKAMVYRHRLKKHIRFGYVKTKPQETFLTSLARPHYYFAIYYCQDGEWLLYEINDHWACLTPDEVAELANKNLIHLYELDPVFANICKVPSNALQLLRMKNQRTK